MDLNPGTRFGRYELLGPLGAGGMGEVYRARDERLGREVAIKVLPPAFANDPDRIARFEREARVLASLNHPGIAAIYELGEQDGKRYLVLELVPGETLAERLRAGPASRSSVTSSLLQSAPSFESRNGRMKAMRLFGKASWIAMAAAIALACLAVAPALAQERADNLIPAPNRRSDEGQGPFKTLVIRSAMLIDGSGGAPRGPVDIVVENNKIKEVRGAGTPNVPQRPNRQPEKPDYEIDATGHYVLPGFVDLHVHAGSKPKNAEAEYAYKLWLAHGVTTVRGVGLSDHNFTVKEKERSARNEIVAPRIFHYQRPGGGLNKGFPDTPEAAREYVRWAAANNVDGLKLGSSRPEIMGALLDEAKKTGLGSTAHLGQEGVAQMNAIKAARLGLGSVTHFYGHFESLLKDTVVQPWPVDQNNMDEQHRFGQVARLWDKIHPPGSPEWKAYLEEHLKLGTTFDPTMTIYSAGRDVMRMREAEWHDKYTLPSLMDFYAPSRSNHGAYWYYWTTWDEVAWRNFYQVWFRLMNDYKKMGGRVTTGSDSGFIYQTYGFGYVLELEMLQEAGFHPLEVVQSATMNGALTLHEPKKKAIEFGVVRAGMLADMVIVDQNPLENFKVLYATGAVKLNDKTGQVERVGGVKYTIKDGIVYDAKKLLADVAAMVEKQKAERAASRKAPAGS